MHRQPPPTLVLLAAAWTCLLLFATAKLRVSAQSTPSVDVSQLPSSIDCGSLTFSVNVSFTVSSPAYLSLYLYDPTATSHPDTDSYGNVTSLPVTSSATQYPITLVLTTAVPCYNSLQWATILSSSSDAAVHSLQLAVGLANVSTAGAPVGCSLSINGFTPDPPRANELTWEYSLLVTTPQPCNVQLTLFDNNYSWYAYTFTWQGSAMSQGLINGTWDWVDVSSRIPLAGTSMIFQWSVFPVGVPAMSPSGSALCAGTIAPAFVTGGHTVWMDEIDTRSLPSILPPNPHPSPVSSTIHLDIFVGWTGYRSLNVSLVNGATTALYFEDVNNYCWGAPAVPQLLSYDYLFGQQGAVWNAGVTQMYWRVELTECYYGPSVLASTSLIPVTIGHVQDEISCTFLPQPDPAQNSYTVYVRFATTGNRTMTVLLVSPDTGVTHAVGSTSWQGGTTSARVYSVYMTLLEGFAAGATGLQWVAYSADSNSGAVVVNATASTTALSSYSVYVDYVTVADFSESLFGRWLLPINATDLDTGYTPLVLDVQFSSAGPRCLAVSVVTLASALSADATSVFLDIGDSFGNISWNTYAPSASRDMSFGFNVSVVGTGGTTLSSETSLLYLAALVYNCTLSQSVDAVWAGSIDVGELLSSGALFMQPLVVSEQVDFIDTALLSQPVAINVYQTSFSLTFPVSLASAADVFVALVSLPQSRVAMQWASGYLSINSSVTLISVTVTLNYQQTPSTDTDVYELVFALAQLGSVSASTSWATINSRYTAAPLNASLYAVQDLVDATAAPATLAPSIDSPTVNLSLSSAAARTLVLALVDTTGWSAALLQQCNKTGSLTTANLSLTAVQTSATSPSPIALSTASNAPVLLYGVATFPISGKVQLSEYVLNLAYVQSIPASYSSLAWVAWLSDTANVAVSYSALACKWTTSTTGTALSNSISTSPLTFSVPYNPLSVTSTAGTVPTSSVTMAVELTIGTSCSLFCTLSLRQLGSSTVYGSSVLSLPYARNPSIYSLDVALSSLPLAQHSDLYWQYSLSYPNGSATTVTGGVYAVSTGSSDSLDVSDLAVSPNISTTILQQQTNGAWILPINVTASTAASRWLYVRVMDGTTAVGVGSRHVLGATAVGYHSVPVLLLQPVSLNTQLLVQVWLAPVSSALTSTVLASQSVAVWFIHSARSVGANTTTTAAIDSLDTSELSQQQYVDCSTSTTTWSADVNVSTADDRMLSVAYIRSDGYQIVVGSLTISGATYMQRRRVAMELQIQSIGLTCSTLLNIEIQLTDAFNSSIVYSTAWVTKLSTSSLSAQHDGVTLSSLAAPLPVANGSMALALSGTIGPMPRYVVAAVMSSDLSVSFADYTSVTLPTLASQAAVSGSLTVRQALVGGSSLHVSLMVIAPLVPSAALDWTVNWQPTTFQSGTQTIAVASTANATLQDHFVNSSLPTNVDPSFATEAFFLSFSVSTNGARDLVVELFTNGSSGLVAFATGVARLESVVSTAAPVSVIMQPILPLVYGMTNLYLSATLLPIGIQTTYPQASVTPYLITTLSQTAATSATPVADSLSVSLPSVLLDTRQSVVRMYLSGSISAGHDINCSLTAVTTSSATTFSYGSAVQTFSSATALSNTAFDVSLSHLLYPNQTDLAVQCFGTPAGNGAAQAVLFSNVVHCSSTNNSAVVLQLSPPRSLVQSDAEGVHSINVDTASAITATTVSSALAYSSGVQPLSFRPYSAVLGTATEQLVFWFPATWTLVTRPPVPVASTTPVSARLSGYISAFGALLEAVELWVLQQRTSWNATDTVSVALYAVNMSALFGTPLCTPSDASTSVLAPSSTASTAQLVNCPDMLIVNNDELAARVERNELLELDDLFSDISTLSGRSLSDDLMRYAEDALLIGSHFYSAGLVTDIRLLYYNKTALSQAGISVPPPGSGSLTMDYSRSWTWSVMSAQVLQLEMTLHGADYEELIVAQMIAQSSNAQLLTTQPTDSSYSTVAGEGSALTSTAYTQAMNSTLSVWLSSNRLSPAVNTSDALWQAWRAESFADMTSSSPLPLTGLATLSSLVDAYIDSLHYAVLAGTMNSSHVYGVSEDVSTAAAGLKLPGFTFDSASLSSHLSSGNEIGYAYVPSGSGYLGGMSVAVVSGSSHTTQCSNLTALLVDNTQPYQFTIADALHALPPYASTWTVAPFDSDEYAIQQVATTLSKPLFSPLSPLADLPTMIAINPHRQLVANLAYKNVTLTTALAASSLSVSSTYFPLVTLTNVGDSISATQAPTYIILAVILSALGAWVSSVLVEQAIFLFHRHDVLGCIGWLFLMSVSLGGGGFWCALLMQAGSLQVNAHPSPDVTQLSVHFALDLAIVLVIPAILLPFIACLLMIDSLRRARLVRTAAIAKGEVVEQSVNQSTTTQNGSNSRSDPTVVAKKRRAKGASLTWAELAEHLAAQMNARVATAGFCLALGLWLVRLLLPHVWLVQANFHNSAAALVVTALVDYVLCTLSLLVLFHAMKGRLIGVFSIPVAMLFDYQLNLALMQWTYASDMSSSMIHVWPVSAQAVSILTGLLGAIVCLLFVGLQFKRMSLSRYALAQQVAKLHAIIEAEKAKTVAAEKRVA